MSFESKALNGLYIITGDFWDRFCALRDPVEDPEIAFSGIGISMLHCGNKSKEYKIELKLKILLKHLHQTVSQSTNVVHLKQVLWKLQRHIPRQCFPHYWYMSFTNIVFLCPLSIYHLFYRKHTQKRSLVAITS